MDLKYTEMTIEWNYNDENKSYYADNIEFVSCDRDLIYIEICKDTGYEYRDLDLNGKDIL